MSFRESTQRVLLITALQNAMVLLFLTPAASAESGPLTYEDDVRPLLKAYCFHCHGEDEELAGGLDLRLQRMIVAGGDSGPAIVPGKRSASLLFDYISSGDMPPGDELQLSPEDVETIGAWIDAGAPLAEPETDVDPVPGELLITRQERSHWSFQPIRTPELPTGSQEPNPIDRFVERKLSEKGLSFSPEADRITLIRRASFDLTGLPPTPEQVEEFVNDSAPDAYERLIDRLLSSPHYGERWARHWLDVVGYADSEGYNDDDLIRPDAWRYRDYVIASFNRDKPWDEFLVEQLAGDELVEAHHTNAQDLANTDPEILEKLVATGFLRQVPDGTGSRPADPAAAKQQVITETVKVISSSLLGITVGCAECHHHRFDPIPQEDFYRLRAIFEPVYDPANWRIPKSRSVAILSEEDRARAAEIEEQAKALDAEHNRIKQEVLETILARVLEDVPEEDRQAAQTAFETAQKERTAEQEELVQAKYPMLGLLRTGTLHLFLARFKDGNELKKSYEDIQAEAAKLRAQKPQPDYVRVATEVVGKIPTTHVFHRGDFTSPEPEAVPPGDLTVLGASAEALTFPMNLDEVATTGRRLAFARHLTSGEHPLVARVLVNRFWLHHFGRGIVSTPGEFGIRGEMPSHPELLDWLASNFMEHGWRLKRLHRLMMTSRTYRQASRQRPEAVAVDADNRYLWRMPVRRLEAEAVRDAMLATSGELKRQLYGDPVPVDVNAGGIVAVGGGNLSDDHRELRRSIYVQVRRTQPVAMLEAFDAPQMEPNCEQRLTSTVATQSLALLNSQFVVRQAEAFAERVREDVGTEASWSDVAAAAWQHAFGASPTAEARLKLTEFAEAQLDDFRARKLKDPERLALASLCHVLLTSNRFLYVD